jgi:hypothetical protein
MTDYRCYTTVCHHHNMPYMTQPTQSVELVPYARLMFVIYIFVVFQVFWET